METGYSIQFSSYKTFQALEGQCNDLKNIGRMNIIIGKNNTGKSKLIDFFDALFTKNVGRNIQKGNSQIDGLKLAFKVEEADIPEDCYMREFIFKQPIGGQPPFICTPFELELNSKGLLMKTNHATEHVQNHGHRVILNNLYEKCTRMVECDQFHRLSADRDIKPEFDAQFKDFSPNGEGATSLLRGVKTVDGKDGNLIKEILTALNKIYGPNTRFEEIDIRQDGKRNNVWEIKLREEGQERYWLSETGSGLKTVILVLMYLLMVGRDDIKKEEEKKKQLEGTVFAFEEIENNLHPAVERNLYRYIYEFAKKNKCLVFMTTHSQTPLNMFFKDEDVQIYRVTKREGKAIVSTVKNHSDKSEILDDLDVRASDLLQSNGIIWVEGPTDKYYIKKWIDTLYPDKFTEGFHYQFMMYGGSNLSHFTLDELETEDLIKILTTNRKALVVMDRNDKLNATQERVVSECKNNNMVCWVTNGREIESYLTLTSLQRALGESVTDECKADEAFSEHMMKCGIDYPNRKTYFAKKIRDEITNDDCDVLDLRERIEEVCKQIDIWNNSPDS